MDARETRDLNGNYVTKTFTCSGPRFFRFVRPRQAGTNSSGTNFLALSQLELFGALQEGAQRLA